MSTLEIGSRFSSYEELEHFISEFEQLNYISLYKRDCRTIENAMKKNPCLKKARPELIYYGIKYTCVAGGRVHKKKIKDGSRQSKTFRQNCPFYINVLLSPDRSFLEVKNMNLSHNHAVSAAIFSSLPKARKLPKEYKDKVINLLHLQANKKLLREQIAKETGKNFTWKDLANIATKVKSRTNFEEAPSTENNQPSTSARLSSRQPGQSCRKRRNLCRLHLQDKRPEGGYTTSGIRNFFDNSNPAPSTQSQIDIPHEHYESTYSQAAGGIKMAITPENFPSDNSNSAPSTHSQVDIPHEDYEPTYSQVAGGIKMAITPENFPSEKLAPEEGIFIQKDIDELIDTLLQEEAPQFSSVALSNGALILHCVNESSAQWLKKCFQGRELNTSKLVVRPASELPKSVKIAFKSRDVFTTDSERVLRRLSRLNPGLSTEEWRVFDKVILGDQAYIRWIFEIDDTSLETIKSKNLELFVGAFGKVLCEILNDPNKPTSSSAVVQVPTDKIPASDVDSTTVAMNVEIVEDPVVEKPETTYTYYLIN